MANCKTGEQSRKSPIRRIKMRLIDQIAEAVIKWVAGGADFSTRDENTFISCLKTATNEFYNGLIELFLYTPLPQRPAPHSTISPLLVILYMQSTLK